MSPWWQVFIFGIVGPPAVLGIGYALYEAGKKAGVREAKETAEMEERVRESSRANRESPNPLYTPDRFSGQR